MPENDPILIVGVGSIGERHLRCFQAGGRVPLAICEVNPHLREEVAQRYGIEHTYADFEEALAHPHLAAVIATPANLHIAMATRAAKASLHLLIEKPLSTGLEGVDELRETILRQRVVAAVAYVHRANPVLASLREAVLSGRFGKPVEIVITTGQHFPTYRPAYRDVYYRDRATGGGAVQDALTHLINAGEWIAGPIDRLVADAAHQVLDGVEVEDTVHVLCRHGEVLGSYALNQYQAPNELTLTVVCERGTARFEYHRNRWRWMTDPGCEWHDESGGALERDSLFENQANAFLNAIEHGTPVPCSLDQGIRTLQVNAAVLASVEQRSWVTLQGTM